MKKIIALVLVLCFVLSFAACAKKTDEPAVDNTTVADDTTEDTNANVADTEKSEGVMTYAEYMAAELDSEVTIEAYVQAKQSWWEDTATVYTADADGAYFLYNMACSEDDYALLVPGAKIKVTGFKSEWSGEVEIADATFELEEGSYIAEAVDATSLFGTDDLEAMQNMFVAVKGAKVVASKAVGDETECAFLYNWDGSGTHEGNSDLYFNVEINGAVFQFTVESYLCDNSTDVYAAVEALEIGQTIDMECFLYWYNGANPHVTSVAVVG